MNEKEMGFECDKLQNIIYLKKETDVCSKSGLLILEEGVVIFNLANAHLWMML